MGAIIHTPLFLFLSSQTLWLNSSVGILVFNLCCSTPPSWWSRQGMESDKSNSSPLVYAHSGHLQCRCIHVCFPGCLWGSSGAALCCRRKFTSITFVDRLCSSCPWRHRIWTSCSVPQTSHWCWNLYSGLGDWSWAMKFWAWKGASFQCYLYYFEHLENTRTNPVKDTYPFFRYLLFKHFPIWRLDLTHNTTKPMDKWRHVQHWCGTGRSRAKENTSRDFFGTISMFSKEELRHLIRSH